MFDNRSISDPGMPGTRAVGTLLLGRVDELRRSAVGRTAVRRPVREGGRVRARSIELKSPAEITAMRMAGRLVQRALEAARQACVPA